MKIPRIPTPDGISGKQWEPGSNGKGCERRPENLKYAKSANLKRTSTPGHTKIVYVKGERITFINGVRQ